VPETALPATDLDLISFLKAIPDARIRRRIRIPAWYLLLVAVLGILSRCQSLRDLERCAFRYHGVSSEALGIELRRPPCDSAFRYFFRQVDVAALCAAIRDWMIAKIPGGAADLDELICNGRTLRCSIEPTTGGGSKFIAHVSPTPPPWAWPSARPATPPARTTSGRCSESSSESWILTAF
jgi:hypothetical protein